MRVQQAAERRANVAARRTNTGSACRPHTAHLALVQGARAAASSPRRGERSAARRRTGPVQRGRIHTSSRSAQPPPLPPGKALRFSLCARARRTHWIRESLRLRDTAGGCWAPRGECLALLAGGDVGGVRFFLTFGMDRGMPTGRRGFDLGEERAYVYKRKNFWAIRVVGTLRRFSTSRSRESV